MTIVQRWIEEECGKPGTINLASGKVILASVCGTDILLDTLTGVVTEEWLDDRGGNVKVRNPITWTPNMRRKIASFNCPV